MPWQKIMTKEGPVFKNNDNGNSIQLLFFCSAEGANDTKANPILKIIFHPDPNPEHSLTLEQLNESLDNIMWKFYKKDSVYPSFQSSSIHNPAEGMLVKPELEKLPDFLQELKTIDPSLETIIPEIQKLLSQNILTLEEYLDSDYIKNEIIELCTLELKKPLVDSKGMIDSQELAFILKKYVSSSENYNQTSYTKEKTQAQQQDITTYQIAMILALGGFYSSAIEFLQNIKKNHFAQLFESIGVKNSDIGLVYKKSLFQIAHLLRIGSHSSAEKAISGLDEDGPGEEKQDPAAIFKAAVAAGDDELIADTYQKLCGIKDYSKSCPFIKSKIPMSALPFALEAADRENQLREQNLRLQSQIKDLEKKVASNVVNAVKPKLAS